MEKALLNILEWPFYSGFFSFFNWKHRLNCLFTLNLLTRLILILICVGWVYVTPYFKLENNEFSYSFFIISIVLEAFHSVAIYTSFIPMAFFFSQISDKNFGGTYLTFLNTIMNLARNWIGTGSLYLANFLSSKYCDYPEQRSFNETKNLTESSNVLNQVQNNFCASESESKVIEIF